VADIIMGDRDLVVLRRAVLGLVMGPFSMRYADSCAKCGPFELVGLLLNLNLELLAQLLPLYLNAAFWVTARLVCRAWHEASNAQIASLNIKAIK
jgi:hypothetical protein